MEEYCFLSGVPDKSGEPGILKPVGVDDSINELRLPIMDFLADIERA